jgi:hypothetical protein
MLTGIGAPTAWPFFKRGGVATPVRRVLGRNADAGPLLTMTLGGINIAAGEFVIVATNNDNRSIAGFPVVDLNGNNLNVDASRSYVTHVVTIQSWLPPGAIVGGTITATWPMSPTNAAILGMAVSNLIGTRKANLNPVGAVTVNPDSGVTAAFVAANSYHCGVVGTVGNGADALGVWQNGMAAGQRVSWPAAGVPPGVDLKEGYLIPAAPVGAQAHIHNQTSRASLAQVVYYE